MGSDGDPEPRRKKHELMLIINWVGLDWLRTPHCMRKLYKTQNSQQPYKTAHKLFRAIMQLFERGKPISTLHVFIFYPLTFLNSVFPEASFSLKRDQI